MRRSSRLALTLFLAVLLVAAVLAAWGGFLYARASRPYKGYDAAEQFVDVPPGSGTREIARKLAESGVVPDEMSFRVALWRSGAARRLRAGEYRFDRPMSPIEVVGKIARGEVYLRSITFPEGLTIADMAAIYEERGFGPAADFRQAASEPPLVADLDPQAKDLEGYLFPNTYQLPRRATARGLVQLMVRSFRKAVGEDFADAAAARGLTVRQAVTLASLVEKETAKPAERPIVAGVYLNRLRIGMGMQCDPTVIYGLQRAGRYTGSLSRADLAFDSPYNTYRYPGLPPGPICAPGRASLEAVENAAQVSYLYFVSRNDGSHEFAATLDEHNRNVYKYQIQYFRQKRLEDARRR